MNSKTTVWLDAVGTADPDSSTSLTAIDTLGSGVVGPAVVAHGGRAVVDEPGTTHLEFAGLAASLAALGQILETSSDSVVGVRAAVGTGLNIQDAEALLSLAGAGEVIVAGGDGSSAGSEWRSTGVGRTQLRGSGRSADVFRLDRTASPLGKGPGASSWTRPLTLLPLGGVGFAAAAVAIRRTDDPSEPVDAEVEALLDGDTGSLEPNAALDLTSGAIAPPEPAEYLPPQIIGGSPEQIENAAEGLRRFDILGLDMPSGLTIYFHEPESYENCGGHVGRATLSDVDKIDICNETPFTMYHELAHVWAHENLDEDERSEFAELRGLEGWRGPEEPREDGRPHPHSEVGTEHAADIIAWGLLKGQIRPRSIGSNNDDASLAIAFEQLIGIPAPHLAEPDPLGLSVVTGGLSETSPERDSASSEDAFALASATSAVAPFEPDAAADQAMLLEDPPVEDDIAGLDAWPDDDDDSDDTPDEELGFGME